MSGDRYADDPAVRLAMAQAMARAVETILGDAPGRALAGAIAMAAVLDAPRGKPAEGLIGPALAAARNAGFIGFSAAAASRDRKPGMPPIDQRRGAVFDFDPDGKGGPGADGPFPIVDPPGSPAGADSGQAA